MDERYPSKPAIGLALLQTFCDNHPDITVQAVLADALYGNQEFMDKASEITACSQIISQLTIYFSRTAGVLCDLIVRGGETKKVTVVAARVYVKSHHKKRFVIALKYEGETEYRFIVAKDLSWRHMDIVRTYTLRWLVEVFIADWKGHDGWNALSKQQGAESATRGVTLSLLCDHLLLLHPTQSTRIKNKQPGMSVGCLIEHINAEALIDSVNHIVHSQDPLTAFNKFSTALQNVLPNRESSKHLVGRDLGRMEPTLSLKYQNAA